LSISIQISNLNSIEHWYIKGKLGFDEFTQLWRNIRHWCSVFKKHDTDNSNTISAHELRTAFHEIGLNVNRTILQLLVHRYGIIANAAKKETNVAKALTFDDFIHSSMKLKHSIDIWNEKAKTGQNSSPANTSPSRYTSNPSQNNPTFTLEEVSNHCWHSINVNYFFF